MTIEEKEKDDLLTVTRTDDSAPLKRSSHSRELESGKTIKLLNKPRITILVIIGLTVLTLIFNIVWLSWASTKSTEVEYIHTLFRGDCNEVKRLKIWLHLLINIMSTVLVTGSSYCIQALNAPSREEVDSAHANGRSCKIGILDVSNMFRISWLKRITICILSFSSLTLHVIFNSTIVNTVATTSYSTLGVRPSFLNGAPFDLKPFDQAPPVALEEVFSIRSNLSNFQRLDNLDCLKAYIEPLVENRGDLLLVLDDSNVPEEGAVNNSILTYRSLCLGCPHSLDWLCAGTVPDWVQLNRSKNPRACTEPLVRLNFANAGNWTDTGGLLGEQEARIQYCLSQTTPNRCALQYSQTMTIVVIGWSTVKLICMIIAALETGRTLMTVGDAVYSYLETPEPIEPKANSKELSKTRSWATRLSSNAHKVLEVTYDRLESPQTVRRWYDSCSRIRFWILTFWLLIIIALGAGFIGKTTVDVADRDYPSDFGHLVTLGFGTVTGQELLHATSTGIVGNSVIANLPQILISVFYFIVNGIMSCQLAEREWNRFGVDNRRLRTSFPSTEKMSFYLSMPYTYSGPLIVLFIALHLGVSQSLFAVQIDFYTWNGVIAEGIDTVYNAAKASAAGETVSTLCASTSAAIFTMMFLGIMVAVIAANSCRRLEVAMPFPGTQSVIIAASTHADVDVDHILGKTLIWRRNKSGSGTSLMHLGYFETGDDDEGRKDHRGD